MPRITYDNFNPRTVALEGSNLIEASAGTGKTYSIAILCLRLIIEKNIPIQKILMVTFTKAAVAELETRVRSFVRLAIKVSQKETIADDNLMEMVKDQCEQQTYEVVTQKLHTAQLFLDETSVLTIHSFCQRTLAEFSFETHQLFGASILSPDEFNQLAADAFNEFWRKHITTIQLPMLEQLNICELSHDTMFSIVKEALSGKKIVSNRFIPDNFLSAAYQNQFLQDIVDTELQVQELYNSIIQQFQENKNQYIAISKKNPSAKANLLSYFESDSWDTLIEFIIKKKNSTNNYIVTVFGPLLDSILQWNRLRYSENPKYVALVYDINIAAIKFVKKAIHLEKNRRGVITYDDMIFQLFKALQNTDQAAALTRAMNAKYEAVFIDEFQDTDREQYAIFEQLFKQHCILFYIGDPKQSIYAFRKADINTYFQAKQEVSVLHQMNINHRSSDLYIKAMNSFFLPTKEFDTFRFKADPHLQDAISYIPVAAPKDNSKGKLLYKGMETKPLKISSYPNKKMLLQGVKDILIDLFTPGNYSIEEHHKTARPIRPSDVGILVRSNNESSAIKKILAQLRIPSVTIDESKLLASEEALQLFYILEAVHTCRRSAINKALLTPLGGYTDTSILQIDEDVLLQQFKHYQQTWKTQGVYLMLRQFIADYNVHQKMYDPLAQQPERSIVNLNQLIEILHKIAFKKKLDALELIQWLKKGMEGDAREGDEYVQRIESDQDAVQLVTIHKSKGLEYNIVLAPHLDLLPKRSKIKNYSFRDPVTGQYSVMDLNEMSDEQKVWMLRQAEQENRRLIYVAITRARYQCYITENKATYYNSSTLKEFLSALQTPASLDAIEFWEQLDVDSSFTFISADQKFPIYLTAQHFSMQQLYWTKTSYSALNPDHIPLPLLKSVATSQDAYDQFIFKELKKGAQTGNLLHFLLEHINFTDASNWSYLIEKSLKRMGIKTSEYMISQLHAMLEELVCTPISASDTFCLQQVSNDKRINELEFDFPLQPFSTKSLEALSSPELPFKIKSIPELEGIMNGKIDLFFEHQQKYYILDWKSNHLGYSIEDYTEDDLKKAMFENNYYLQYLIYTIAVCKYLSIRKKDFNYERDFGGVFYLFVRGVRKEGTTGIFFHKPDEALLDAIKLVIEQH